MKKTYYIEVGVDDQEWGTPDISTIESWLEEAIPYNYTMGNIEIISVTEKIEQDDTDSNKM